MLDNIPTGINAMVRNVVINHPNAFNCEVYRRTVLRPDPQAGGAPTMGGMLVMSVEEESEILWSLVGMGFALPAEAFQPAPMMDRRDANNGEGDEFKFLIEPEEMLGNPGGFEVAKNDVVYVILGTGDEAPRVAYEIVAVEAMVNIPPYVPRYIANRRSDLDIQRGQVEEDD